VRPGSQGRLPARAPGRTAAFILLYTWRNFALQRRGLLPVAGFLWADLRTLAAGWWRRQRASSPATFSHCCAPQVPTHSALFKQAKSI